MGALQNKTIGFLGAGQMAEAIFAGAVTNGVLTAENITVTDVSPDRLAYLQQRHGVAVIENDAATNAGAKQLVQNCDIVVLAVKPQLLRPILGAVGPSFDAARHTAISIIGGATLATIEDFIHAPVVRVMPNTPMKVGLGAAGIASGRLCSDAHTALAQELFGGVGISYILPERLIDPLTSVSGCGPAFAYLFLEALADGGVEMGLPRETAQTLAAQTLKGAAEMVLTGGHPATLKDAVCSPGGSTIVGVHALEAGGLRAAVMDAVKAAMQRMEEVGKQV